MWIDISQTFHNEIAHWPGDTPFSYAITFPKSVTGSVNIGKITTSVHTGTHVDAPFHFNDNGETIEQLDIQPFIGTALLVDVSAYDHITVNVFSDCDFSKANQLLLRTVRKQNQDQFPVKIPTISPDIAPFLREKGIRLLGVDVPSVDPLDSKDMESHHTLYQHGIAILENVVLHHLTTGLYDLIALPLKIKGADGSPVRAVVRKWRDSNE
ncbi:arylformamidase [Bacillus kexueae]|uniref:arylformamidase n=1 Tax=Aeribacillus kexueae TaxID=2078952 RepID=UPI001FAF4705|nr:arylformamidase [Bacillus kexueae]